MKHFFVKSLVKDFRLYFLLCLMLFTGTAQVFADTVSYQFTSSQWNAVTKGASSDWVSIKRGDLSFSPRLVLVTKDVSGACGNSPISFDNISSVTVHYATNTGKGKGTISVYCVESSSSESQSGKQVGDCFEVNAPTTDNSATFKTSSCVSGHVQIYVTCNENSIYIKSVDIEYASTSPVLRSNVSALDFGSIESGMSKVQSFKLSGSNLTSDAMLSVDGDAFSVNPSSISANNGEISGTDVMVTYSPKTVGTHHATLTISSSAVSKVISLSGTAIAPLEHHTVTWMVNGNPYKEGDPSLDVVKGQKVTTLPSAPQAIEGKEFVGWSNSSIPDITDEAPLVLFTDASSAPEVNSDVVYYAVFAKKTGNAVTYEKLDNEKFSTTAKYVIGAEYNGQLYCFYKYTKVDEKEKWGLMSKDSIPIVFELSGKPDQLEVKDDKGNYLAAVEAGFKMSSEPATVKLYSNGAIHYVEPSISLKLKFNPDTRYGLRWYNSDSFEKAYFYEICGGVTYSDYCTTVVGEPLMGTVGFKAIDNGTRYATFSSTRDVVFVGDVEVAGLKVENSIMTLLSVASASYVVTDLSAGGNGEIVGRYVPANTGVLLKSNSENASYYFPKNSHEVGLLGNMLKPAPVGGGVFQKEPGYSYYKLAYNNYSTKQGLGFYWGADEGGVFKVKEGLAYLAVPNTDAQHAKGFCFDGVTDGIDGVELDCNKPHDIYNLMGQRVVRTAPGLYVVNGKKVLIKK